MFFFTAPTMMPITEINTNMRVQTTSCVVASRRLPGCFFQRWVHVVIGYLERSYGFSLMCLCVSLENSSMPTSLTFICGFVFWCACYLVLHYLLFSYPFAQSPWSALRHQSFPSRYSFELEELIFSPYCVCSCRQVVEITLLYTSLGT